MYTQTIFRRITRSFFSLIIILGLLISTTPQKTEAAMRDGAWLDSLGFEVVDSSNALNAIDSGDIDLYASGLKDEYANAESDPDLETETSNAIYYDLTFNPSGPVFTGTGKLNPFSVPKIREAMNLLIDRRYMVENIMSDLADPMFLPLSVDFPDYVRYGLKVTSLEEEYAYDFALASSIINTEMLALGATWNVGSSKWMYGAEQVELIIIIRNDGDGLRIPMGDYIADQLQSLGFLVDRQYKTSSQASPIWLMSVPADGLWHMYTGAWSGTLIDRDAGDNFQFFYDPSSAYGFTPLWSAYTPTPEFHDLNNKLAYNNDFSSMAERDLAFERALELAMEDSVRIWLLDGSNYYARAADTTTAYDLASGLARLYPYTTRFVGIEGGDMFFGNQNLFVDPWNPVAGSTWTYDQLPIQATADDALLPNPVNGLPMPQRIEHASVIAKAGLPIYRSSNWVDLEFEPVITVPGGAWADWNATSQKFITVADKYPGGPPVALIKSVVVYPVNLLGNYYWHDGSPLSLADFVLGMILPYDRTDPASAIYDSFAENPLDSLIAFRIIDDNPLTIETYTANWHLDAELNVYTWWPKGDYGPLPWHTTALAAELEAKGGAAFSFDKADDLGKDWINYLYGDSLTNMAKLLNDLPDSFIPYPPTMENFIQPGDAAARWENLRNWYRDYGHFWVGDGPFFVGKYDWALKKLQLAHFKGFPDTSGKWDKFNAEDVPTLKINYLTGAPGSYFTISGEEFPAGGVAALSINGSVLTTSQGIDAAGRFEIVIWTNTIETGCYTFAATSTTGSASIDFTISNTAPSRTMDSSGSLYVIPTGIITRLGGWADSLTFVEETDDPLTAIHNDDIDLDVREFIVDHDLVKNDPQVETATSHDIYYELTFNPVGPEFTTGKLNPFSVPAIREAMNKLIDRNYLVNSVFDGLAEPRWLPINNNFPDYTLYKSMIASLETEYAYDYYAAKTVIDAEMLTLGAYKVGVQWYYDGSPVILTLLIRNDSNGKRIPLGDYVADQLESIGFTVDKLYKNSADAATLWLNGDPADGSWHIYTAAWSSTEMERDMGANFEHFYSPNSPYGFSLLWQAYTPTPTFAALMDNLAYNNFTTIGQRDTAFQQALDLAMEDSVRIFLVEGLNYLSRSVLTTTSYDLSTGMARIYPYTVQFTDDPGGNMLIGSAELLMKPWNPVEGSTYTQDTIPIAVSMDDALLPDPTDAFPMPQRIESAEVTAKTGLPVIKTKNWLTLDFDSSISVPPDAWAGWNAFTQEFISYADMYGGSTPPETLVKSVVTYPADLFATVKWHDGSPLSLGDFVMGMILPFDRTDGGSMIYDDSALSHQGMVAFRIASVDPLIIETYLTEFQLDAELNVVTWWPATDKGPMPWHTTDMAIEVEKDGWAAFSESKALALGVPQMDFIGASTSSLMYSFLTSMPVDTIPYYGTLVGFISEEEAILRRTNLKAWYLDHSHFWVGDGPYYLDYADPYSPQLYFERYLDFPDAAGKWDEFVEVPVPALHINYSEGAPGSWFTVIGENYPPYFTNGSLYINGVLMTSTLSGDEYGSFLFLLNTDDADVGAYVVTVTVNPTASTNFILRESAPTRPMEDFVRRFDVPAGIAYHLIYLPMIIR